MLTDACRGATGLLVGMGCVHHQHRGDSKNGGALWRAAAVVGIRHWGRLNQPGQHSSWLLLWQDFDGTTLGAGHPCCRFA